VGPPEGEAFGSPVRIRSNQSWRSLKSQAAPLRERLRARDPSGPRKTGSWGSSAPCRGAGRRGRGGGVGGRDPRGSPGGAWFPLPPSV